MDVVIKFRLAETHSYSQNGSLPGLIVCRAKEITLWNKVTHRAAALPTLSSRRSYHKVKLVFLSLHSLVPSYFSLYFTRFSNIHNHSTRQSMRLSLPNVNKQNFGKTTFLFTDAKIFNNLPLNIMKSEAFKRCAAEQGISFIITLTFYYILGFKCDFALYFLAFNVLVLKFYYNCIFIGLFIM